MKLGIIQQARNLWAKAIGQSQADIRALIKGNTFKGFLSPTFRNLAREAFRCSELVYFILNDIAQSGAGVPLDLQDQPDWVVKLMAQPEVGSENKAGKLYKTWMYEQLIYKQLSGSAYAESTQIRSTVADLPVIRPDWIIPLEAGVEELRGWQVTRFGLTKEFPVSEIFWSKKLDPLRLNHGFPPLAASTHAFDQRCSISRLNMQVLNNDGAVKGIMKLIKPKDGFTKTPGAEEMKEIKKAVNQAFGAENEGGIAVTNWDMVWEQLGQTGREMDWSKTKEQNAREIAIGNGYPPFLLGFSTGSTFTNLSEARQWLWNHTVIPWVEGVLCDLTVHLRMVSGDMSIELKLDKTQILSIQEQMVMKRDADRKDWDSGLITMQEWRERNGFDENPQGDFKLDLNRLSLPLDE